MKEVGLKTVKRILDLTLSDPAQTDTIRALIMFFIQHRKRLTKFYAEFSILY